MISSLRQALTQPGSFFEREAADPRLKPPAIVVAVVALAGLLASLPVFVAVLNTVQGGARVFVLVGLVFGAVVGLVTPFVVWLLYAALFYALSIVFDGSGEFRDLFAVTGWGFAPNILATLVGAVVTAVLLAGQDLTDPQQAQQLAEAAAFSPLGLVNRGFSLLMTLWSGWVWAHAVAATRDIEFRQAGIVVGVVVVAGFLAGIGSSLLV